ncbi:MAG: hypothetical protein U5K54_14460 [Cytophagales bacterium]|nr:hypothetical protein [Cytophagales bacterium]
MTRDFQPQQEIPAFLVIFQEGNRTLYHFVSDDIKVAIGAYFEGGLLVIDGYNIGKRVKEYWGDSDYECVLKIPAIGVDFLYRYLDVKSGDRLKLSQCTLPNAYNT